MTAKRPTDPVPTAAERAFLLRCADVWDRVAAAWDGPLNGAARARKLAARCRTLASLR